jgi:hypothetical protein
MYAKDNKTSVVHPSSQAIPVIATAVQVLDLLADRKYILFLAGTLRAETKGAQRF